MKKVILFTSSVLSIFLTGLFLGCEMLIPYLISGIISLILVIRYVS